MAQKKVLIVLNHAPYGTIYHSEGLRAAVGVTAGIDEHTVDTVYLGDAVFFGLKGVDRTDSAKYLGTLAKSASHPRVEKEALHARGIKSEDLAEDVQVISRADILGLIEKADVTIDF